MFRLLSVSVRLSIVLLIIGFFVAPGASAAGEPEITAQYAVVIDAKTGTILYDKSMNTPAAPASLTKIFTSIYAIESASLDRTLTVDPSDLVGESSMGLSAGDTVSLKTALYGMLLPSGNDAAMTVAQNLGAQPGDTPQQSVDRYVGWLNDLAARLGLNQTHLVNPHGLDQDGHVTTAHDLAAITMYALKNPTFRQIISSSTYSGDGFSLLQANRLLGSYPGLIGGKTGITDNAGFCLIEAAERDGHTVIAVLMKSTDAAWYQDANMLLDYGFSAIQSGESVTGDPAITLSPVLVQPGMPTAAATTQTAGAQVTQPETSHLSVHQVSDNVAVVSHNLLPAGSSGFSWKWPFASLITMLAMLAIVLNYQVVIGAGSLFWRHRGSSRVVASRLVTAGGAIAMTPLPHLPARERRITRARRGRARRREITRTMTAPTIETSTWSSEQVARSSNSRQDVVSLNAAETIATRAVRLALRGEYHAASSEFMRALKIDSTFDLTSGPGFWGMQPAGYVAAARAYALNDRTADAKSLLTVIKLSCGSHKELEWLLNQVVTPAAH